MMRALKITAGEDCALEMHEIQRLQNRIRGSESRRDDGEIFRDIVGRC